MLNEIQAVQNPALGAAVIWRFAVGYIPSGSGFEGVPISLSFIALPLILYEETRKEISSTRAGIHKFEEKYREKYDLLYAIQNRAIAMRDLSRSSIATGIASGLLTLVPAHGVIWPSNFAAPRDVPPPINDLLKAAEKLGGWARQVSLFELSKIFHVDF